MYLSPGLAPPTYTPPPSPRSYPQRHRGAARRSLSVIPSAHAQLPFLRLPSVSVFLLPFVVGSNLPAPLPLPHLYATTVRNTHARSLHAAFTFPCVLTHVYFSPHSSPFSSTPSCAWRRFTVAFIGHQTHTKRRGIQTPSNRRVVSRRAASRRVASCSVGSSRSHRLLH